MSKAAKKMGRKQASWTAEDSSREMRKWTTMTKASVDPSVKKVQEALEGNMDYFLDNVGSIVAKYALKMQELLALLPLHNEKTDEAPIPFLEGNPAPVKVIQIREVDVASPKLPEGATEEEKKAFEEKKKKDEEEAAEDDDADSDESSECDPSAEAPEVVYPDNTKLLEELAMLKREAYELGTTFDGIHDWIALNIPDMKEADGVGVEVMDAVMEQVTSLSDSLRSVYELELKYVDDRSDMEVAAAKYPDSASHLARIGLHDSETWDDIERGWRTLARASLLLHSVLAKNMKKLRDPHAHRTNVMSM